MRIGQAGEGAADPVAAVLAVTGVFRLVAGKITDVDRRTTAGFARGAVEIEGLGADAGRVVRLEFQNENLVALEAGLVRASVPDLITVLDTATAGAIGTERLRDGQRVTVIAFGYDVDYLPVEELAGRSASRGDDPLTPRRRVSRPARFDVVQRGQGPSPCR